MGRGVQGGVRALQDPLQGGLVLPQPHLLGAPAQEAQTPLGRCPTLEDTLPLLAY